MGKLAAFFVVIWCGAARACDLALVLAIDVSGSVDRREYAIQIEGLAAALEDGIVAEALVDQAARVTLVQWSGASRQEQSIPWVPAVSMTDVAILARRIRETPRRWQNYSTAVGEALALSIGLFDQVPACKRLVVDVSGDGISNEGIEPATLKTLLRAREITVNALAIETGDTDLTGWFYENLIHGEGAFVVTANGFEDYPAEIRRKLQRETTRQISVLDK